MNNVSIRTSRVLLAVAAAGLVGLTAAGCASSSAAPTPAGPVAQSTTAGPATSSPATGAGAPVAVAVAKLQFPNTSDDVEFTGYDAKNNMARFHKVVQAPGVPHADLIPDPSDPATHELPMAPGAKITSIDPNGFPFETCPPTHCTVDDVIASVIGHENDAFFAHIHVNAADQIDSVRQSAY
jgi:predicted component of type VI protein secretion system